MVAVSMVVMLVIAGMVLDFGLARLDRQANKSAADAAIAGGLQSVQIDEEGHLYTYQAACRALEVLKANLPQITDLTWADCSDPTKLGEVCNVATSTGIAQFTGTMGNYTVQISSPYVLTGSGYTDDEALPYVDDVGIPELQGCDQLAVIVTQQREPGLGSLAGTADLATTIRSVGRVDLGSFTDTPVALLTLEQTRCDSIVVGGGSYIHVNAVDDQTPGFVGSDSDGSANSGASNCNGGNRVLTGGHEDGILAQKSATFPGMIQVRAIGVGNGGKAYDSTINVNAQGGVPTAGSLVTRMPVDDRYREGVLNAESEMPLQSPGSYAAVYSCGGADDLSTFVDAPSLWIDCPGQIFQPADGTVLNANSVYINATSLSPLGSFALPRASRVYLTGGDTNAISIPQGGSFRLHHGSTEAGCPDVMPERGRLIIAAGGIGSNGGGSLNICETTVIMMGGPACQMPAPGAAPSDSPLCSGALDLNGNTVWTGPNLVGADPPATETDYFDLEDLALWTESTQDNAVGTPSSVLVMAGTFFIPSATLSVNGGSTQNFRNAQYIVRSLRATGGSQIDMAPTYYDSVTIPIVSGFTMVR